MSGKIKNIIDTIIEQRANGNPFLISTTKAKIAIKGVDPDKYTNNSEDDPLILDKLSEIAKSLNVNIAI